MQAFAEFTCRARIKLGIAMAARSPTKKQRMAHLIILKPEDLFLSSLIQFDLHLSANSVAGFYLLRLAMPKW